MKFKVNTKLLPVKACYFFFFGGVAPILPFLPVFARQLGVSEVGVGAVYLALPVLAVLTRPLVGGLADATHRHKLVFLLVLAATTLGYAALSLLPQVPAAPRELAADVRLVCAGMSFVSQCADARQHCRAERLAAGLAARNDTTVCQLQCDRWPDCGGRAWCRPAAPLRLPLDLAAADREGLCVFLPLRNVTADGALVDSPSCAHSDTVQCRLSCADAPLMALLGGRANDTAAYYEQGRFWLLVVFMMVAWVGTSVSVPLADAIALKLIDDPSQYGHQRVWGSIGWGIFSFISGYLVDRASTGMDTKDFSHAFYMLIGLMILNLAVCTRLRVSTLKEAHPKFRAGLGSLLCRPRVLLFLLSCCVVGIMTGVVWTFLFLHLHDVATAWDCSAYEWISLISGATLFVQCFFGEVPLFFTSGWLIRKLGHVHTQTVVMLAFGVRFLLYSLLQNPWLVLPIDLLNGLTFGLFYANMVAYAGVIAPPGMTATLQGLVGASFECIGVAIGGGTGGLLYSATGGARTFQVFGLLSLTAGALHVLMQCIVTYRYDDQPGDASESAQSTDGTLTEMRPLSSAGRPAEGVALVSD